MKKTLIFLLLFSFLLLFFTSCSEQEVKEEELFPIVEELVEESKILNEIIFGEGIPTLASGETVGYYRECNMLMLKEWGFESAQDIRAAIRRIYSRSMSSFMEERAFASLTAGDAVSGARYYETLEGVLMADGNADVFLTGDVVYDYSTLRIISQHRGIVSLKMEATVESASGLTQVRTIELEVERSGDEWKLNSPTYLVYDEYLDKID